MSCLNCGHDTRHTIDGTCPTFMVPAGWCGCKDYVRGEVQNKSAFVSSNGAATLKKLHDDTKAFRDKSVADHEAKNRKRAPLSMMERMRLGGIKPR